MKGLMIKDFEILKSNRRFLTTYVILIAAFALFNPSFSLVYLCILTSSFIARTISYDERNHGLLYIFSWPVSRSEYVTEKYLLSLSVTLAAGLILAGVFGFFELMSWQETGISLLSGWITAVVSVALFIPVELKYGTEKSSLAFVLIFALMALCIAFFSISPTGVPALGFLANLSDEAIIIGLVAVSLLLILGSAWISNRILKKKEF